MSTPAILALADGSLFYGTAIGAEGETSGEVVFNTAMTGYQEILTDPSYSRQIVTLTYPHIGNTGVNEEDIESDRVQAAGLIIRDLPLLVSNWRSTGSLQDYLRDNNVVGIADIDTRRLTRILRDKGSQNGAVVAGANATAERALELANAFPGLKGMDLAKEVTSEKPGPGARASGISKVATVNVPNRSSRLSPGTTASSSTSCACWPVAVAISLWCRLRPRHQKCWR